ncbi:neuronal acetylcholine receptor subunit alpha-3-like [Ylistrum balloti]|uniref:neuronal acetylcholine receptor subunit alpha-3-like n=1 Tax=Ylistrum balloti TaxID=509963 RepID=UPI002905A45F|nr:neuronal acetylcholine receptor subunit alpha-3-like [Ylistrum balloti]
MAPWDLLALTFILMFHTQDVFCQTSDDVKSLLTQILTTDSYNKFVRPSDNHSLPTNVYCSMFLVSITDIDEVKEKMTTTAYLELVWDDTYFVWTPGNYNGINYVYIPQSEIWKPDIALKNGFTKMKELGDKFILAYVYFDGEVYWYPYEVFETKCSIDISYFPFDEQICDIKLGVWSSTHHEISVQMGERGMILDEYQENGEWHIVKTQAETFLNDVGESQVVFKIHVKRKPEYHLYNMVLPVILLSLLAVFTFVIPVDSGEKMGFCMTMFLAFAVFLTIVGAQLPASSTQSLLSKYLIFLVVIGTLIIMFTAIELRINYRNTESFPIPTWLKLLVKTSRIIHCRQPCSISRNKKSTIAPSSIQVTKVSTLDSEDPEQLGKDIPDQSHSYEDSSDNIEWTDVVSALDFYFFWLFLITDILGTIIMLASGYALSKK